MYDECDFYLYITYLQMIYYSINLAMQSKLSF